MPLRIPTSTSLGRRIAGRSRIQVTQPDQPQVLRADTRRKGVNLTRYRPSLVTAATVDDWVLACRTGLVLPDLRLRWVRDRARAVIVGHPGRCGGGTVLPATTAAELLGGTVDSVLGHYELSLCLLCSPAPLQWYLEVSGLAVRAYAVSAPLRSGWRDAAAESGLTPALVAALGTVQHPSPAVLSLVQARERPPEQTAGQFIRATVQWSDEAMRQTYAAVEDARSRLYTDQSLAAALTLAGADADVDPPGTWLWAFIDMAAVLHQSGRPDHKVATAMLLHASRFPTSAVSPDGRWWAVRIPAAWEELLAQSDAVHPAGVAHPLEDSPLLVGAALRLWNGAGSVAGGVVTEPCAALSAARTMLS